MRNWHGVPKKRLCSNFAGRITKNVLQPVSHKIGCSFPGAQNKRKHRNNIFGKRKKGFGHQLVVLFCKTLFLSNFCFKKKLASFGVSKVIQTTDRPCDNYTCRPRLPPQSISGHWMVCQHSVNHSKRFECKKSVKIPSFRFWYGNFRPLLGLETQVARRFRRYKISLSIGSPRPAKKEHKNCSFFGTCVLEIFQKTFTLMCANREPSWKNRKIAASENFSWPPLWIQT